MNTGYKVEYDSSFKNRADKWFIATVTWTIQFNTTFNITKEPYIGAQLNPLSTLGYGYTIYVKLNFDWRKRKIKKFKSVIVTSLENTFRICISIRENLEEEIHLSDFNVLILAPIHLAIVVLCQC